MIDNKKDIEGFEIVSEKSIELDKNVFFKMLAGAEAGLTLTVERTGKFFKSKYDPNKTGCFIDYSFIKDSKKYEVGIYYNLGNASEDGKVTLTSNMNIFRILEIVVDLTEANEIRVTEEFIENVLTGATFIAELGTGYNGGFLIEPMKLI